MNKALKTTLIILGSLAGAAGLTWGGIKLYGLFKKPAGTPPAGEGNGTATTDKYKCSGAPDYTCIKDAAGTYNSIEECQAACKNPNPAVQSVQDAQKNVNTFFDTFFVSTVALMLKSYLINSISHAFDFVNDANTHSMAIEDDMLAVILNKYKVGYGHYPCVQANLVNITAAKTRMNKALKQYAGNPSGWTDVILNCA